MGINLSQEWSAPHNDPSPTSQPVAPLILLRANSGDHPKPNPKQGKPNRGSPPTLRASDSSPTRAVSCASEMPMAGFVQAPRALPGTARGAGRFQRLQRLQRHWSVAWSRTRSAWRAVGTFLGWSTDRSSTGLD